MNRELSSFDIYVLVSELQHLSGSHIGKCYQIGKDEILIKLSKPEKKTQLYVKNESFICETVQPIETPTKPSTFAMTLRKYLTNGRITSIEQYGFDRIILINIQKKEGDFQLVFELFKNGNIIIVNPEGTIVLPLKIQHWAHRSLKPHQPYVPPPIPANPFTLSYEEFITIIRENKKDLVRTLAVSLNMSGTYAEELCKQAAIDKNQKTQEIDDTTAQHLFSQLQQLLNKFTKHDFNPSLVLEADVPVDILPFPLKTYETKSMKPIETFNQGLCEFIQQQTQEETVKESPWEKKRQKLQRQLVQQQQIIEQFQQEIKEKKKQGDIIYLHYQTIDILLQKAVTILQQKNKEDALERLQEEPRVESFDLSKGVLQVKLPDNDSNMHMLFLRVKKNVAGNADLAYNEAKKLQKKLEGAQKALIETQNKIEHLEKQKPEPQEQKTKQQAQKHFWFESYRWSITSQGNIIVAGRDAKTNERVVKKYLTEEDRYIHADIHGAPSCVIKNTDIHGKPLSIDEKSLEEACIFAASYSRAWKQFAEAQAYWVRPEQVSKTPQSGEFVPRGAFIIRGKRNYHQCKLEVAIGKTVLDDAEKIIAGAVSAVRVHSKSYVVLQPGSDDATSMAKQIANRFHVSVDEVLQAMPPGPVQLIEQVGSSKE